MRFVRPLNRERKTEINIIAKKSCIKGIFQVFSLFKTCFCSKSRKQKKSQSCHHPSQALATSVSLPSFFTVFILHFKQNLGSSNIGRHTFSLDFPSVHTARSPLHLEPLPCCYQLFVLQHFTRFVRAKATHS